MKDKNLLFLLPLLYLILSSFNFYHLESKVVENEMFLSSIPVKDRDCIVENYQKIELCLIETFSKEWYDDLCEQDKASNHRFYFHIITNSQGKILSIEKDKLFKGMTEYEFEQFALSFKRNYDVCIFPPRGSTLQEFRAKHGNRLPFSFLYFPNKTRTFLENWRLNNG
ncbi:hypothetical protein WAF17_05215 [Bernardetia sp. ABR2-2B]|uniref:hypothetical protein n=1 Tax=Bernardetia sp. ABR2-2B TaxID=3127472 RepID=UPI0030D12A66